VAEPNILALVDAYERWIASLERNVPAGVAAAMGTVDRILTAMGIARDPVRWKVTDPAGPYDGIETTLRGVLAYDLPQPPWPRHDEASDAEYTNFIRRMLLGDTAAAKPVTPGPPERDEPDRLPLRRRNTRIGCEQYASGTWIHGRPHDCPRWVR
jgi:hypothetical protein